MPDATTETRNEDQNPYEFCLYFGSSPTECSQKLSTANADLVLLNRINESYEEALGFLLDIKSWEQMAIPTK